MAVKQCKFERHAQQLQAAEAGRQSRSGRASRRFPRQKTKCFVRTGLACHVEMGAEESAGRQRTLTLRTLMRRIQLTNEMTSSVSAHFHNARCCHLSNTWYVVLSEFSLPITLTCIYTCTSLEPAPYGRLGSRLCFVTFGDMWPPATGLTFALNPSLLHRLPQKHSTCNLDG
jgi:hypothetical protein